MKTFYIREDVKKRYLFDGFTALMILAIFIIYGQKTFSSITLQLLFYLVLFGYAMLHVLKFKTCRLILKDDELEFHSGMLSIKKIPYKDIRKIEYNPEILIRFYLKKDERYTRMLNVFSDSDTEEIFDYIKSKNKRVNINYIDIRNK